MAEDSQISATSYSITAESQPMVLNCYTVNNPNLRLGLDKKIYIPLYVNNMRVIACVDSGSDLTLMQHTLYSKLAGNQKLRKSQVGVINSYSDNVIKVKGETNIFVKFSQYSPPVSLTIIIIEDIAGSITPFLFGNDSFKTCMATLAYTGNVADPQPEFTVHVPEKQNVKLYYASPSDIMSCKAKYVLEKYETATLEFKLHPAAPVTRKDEILISSEYWEDVHIITSKTDLDFDTEKDCYLAQACAMNLTDNRLVGIATVGWELLGNYDSIRISEQNKSRLVKLMSVQPPVRQILSRVQ